jgi:hypothetical protein
MAVRAMSRPTAGVPTRPPPDLCLRRENRTATAVSRALALAEGEVATSGRRTRRSDDDRRSPRRRRPWPARGGCAPSRSGGRRAPRPGGAARAGRGRGAYSLPRRPTGRASRGGVAARRVDHDRTLTPVAADEQRTGGNDDERGGAVAGEHHRLSAPGRLPQGPRSLAEHRERTDLVVDVEAEFTVSTSARRPSQPGLGARRPPRAR